MGDRRSNGVQTEESYRVVPGHRDEPVRHGLQRGVADQPPWNGPGPPSVEQIVEAARSCAAVIRIFLASLRAAVSDSCIERLEQGTHGEEAILDLGARAARPDPAGAGL